MKKNNTVAPDIVTRSEPEPWIIVSICMFPTLVESLLSASLNFEDVSVVVA